MKILLSITFFIFSVTCLWSQFPGCPDVDAGADQTTNCPNECTTLTAAPIVSGLTTSYTASAVEYAPPIAFNAPGGTPISVATDDVWSPTIQLPFNFCFYGQTFTACQVGSNGAIRMGPGQTGNHPWQFSSQVPSNNLVSAGNIFGIYHDIDPSVPVAGGGQVRWYLLGEAPCRIFVVSFYEMAHFSCTNLRSTHMMVLYETTNVIDVYVEKKQTCNNWNGGRAVIGIQNFNGSQGIAAPGRNTGPWTVTTPEAWRFSPAGAPTYTVSWFQNNQLISSDLSLQVCPSETTTYTASVTYTPCAGGNPVTVTDDVTVNVNQGVVPSFAPITSSYCTGANIPNLPTTSQNGISGAWTPAINNQQTITYTFQPNPGQCASPVETTITITPVQIPSFSFPTSYCVGDNIPAFPSTSNNGFQGNWTPAVNNQQTTVYTFIPSPGQCASTLQQTVEVLPIEAPEFDLLSEYCQGTNIPPLPVVSVNGISGSWTPVLNNQETTNYTFIPDAGSCATGAIDWLIEIIENVDPVFSPIDPYCFDSEIPALPTQANNNIQGVWSPAINNQQTTTYTFNATDSGCFNQVNLTIEILPILESLTEHALCENALPLFWNGMALFQDGLYEAYFTGSNGCDSIARVQFSVMPTLESMTIINSCENDLPIIWNGLSIMTSGSYNVALTSSTGCDSIAYLSAHVRPIPNVEFSADLIEGCGSFITNFSIISNDPYVESRWSFSDGLTTEHLGDFSRTFDVPGCYDAFLELTTQYGCKNQSEKFELICVYPNPIADFIINPGELDVYNQTAYFINQSQDADTYFWDFGHEFATSTAVNPSYIYPETPGQYVVWLIAENDFGCIDSTHQYIDVIIEPVYYIPNAFTPDGDAFNNVFLPVFTSGFDPFSYQLLIFNRWGQVLFESNNAAVGWDGTYGGKLMQDGVYIYQISFRDLYSDKRHEVKGHVNLLR